MLVKALAYETGSRLLNITASSLASRHVDEGEKLIQSMFSAARQLQPSIIFIDDVDDVLGATREASRKLKTTLFAQFDGLSTGGKERVVVIAATNKPQELDDAALRRFTKRVYVTLPDEDARLVLLENILIKQDSPLSIQELKYLARVTSGFPGSDLTALAKEAALGATRGLSLEEVRRLNAQKLRNVTLEDFITPLEKVRGYESSESLELCEQFNRKFGDISV
ncbi:hypothetical protein HPB51_024792 [Rhipicephalus microplus]|uniref:ATPase AAA-type core domain-containing protein n=1 Tax=Rhipicephalus microplus TaxID=6941 RepID=A0A9J6DE13_RHIMP|nr:hypothetical protein HPB51_024792 [Rhipicephalus microplus]